MNSAIYNECGSRDIIFILLVRHMKAIGLCASEVIFLAYLASSGEGYRVSVSLKAMHRETGLATGTIHAAKKRLVAKGLVQILNTRNKERTNTYSILPLREKLAEFAEWRLPATPEPKADSEESSQ